LPCGAEFHATKRGPRVAWCDARSQLSPLNRLVDFFCGETGSFTCKNEALMMFENVGFPAYLQHRTEPTAYETHW